MCRKMTISAGLMALALWPTLNASAAPIPYTGAPPRVLVAPFPSGVVPPPPSVPGKEYSNGNCELPGPGCTAGQPGDISSAGIPTPGQTVRWDGLGGTTDTTLFTGDGLSTPAPNGGQVDAMANEGDVLFNEVVSNRTNLLFSTDLDPRILFETPGGGGGVWAMPTMIHDNDAGAPYVTDVDGLEVWGSDSTDDATHYSLESGTHTGSSDPGGVAVWEHVAAGPDTMLITDAAFAAAISPLIGLGPINEDDIDLDAMMLQISITSILFSLDPIDGILDGGEIFVWDYVNSATASYLFHGGHLWDTAFDVMGTFGTLSENINALEAASVVPAPATLALLGLGLAGIGVSRRRKHLG